VYVVADGVSSCNKEEVPIALARLRHEGAVVTTSESFMYEFVGDAGTPEYVHRRRWQMEVVTDIQQVQGDHQGGQGDIGEHKRSHADSLQDLKQPMLTSSWKPTSHMNQSSLRSQYCNFPNALLIALLVLYLADKSGNPLKPNLPNYSTIALIHNQNSSALHDDTEIMRRELNLRTSIKRQWL
jgi:hypothetical protein